MSECQRCGAKSPNAFLCGKCEATVRDVLAELPQALDWLTDAAIGRVRMGDNGGRRSARRKDLDGEKTLAECIERFPDDSEEDLDRARRARSKAALAHALATGGINARASELLAEINDSLQYWVRELCDARNAVYTPPRRTKWTALGSEYAIWLRINVAAISASELAVDISGDIEGHLDDILEVINRPVTHRFLGPCPAWVDSGSSVVPASPCGARLHAPEDAVEVYCRRCRTTHNVNRLLLSTMDEIRREPITFELICEANKLQPDSFRIPLRTLQQWRSDDRLKVRGWRRPDGRHGIARHGEDDVPLYLWADVCKLRAKKPQKALTGAAAHRVGS